MSRIAILGLGAMGSRMAYRLAQAGHALNLWNRSPRADGEFAKFPASVFPSPRAAVANADFVLSMVRDDSAAHFVWLAPDSGALAGVKRGATIIECSTVTPRWARLLHAHADEIGVSALDAPVLGSRLQAETGQLIFLVGGTDQTFASAEGVLRPLGSGIHHVGGAGKGSSMKLALNTVLVAQTVALAEFFSLARETDIDTELALSILAATPLASASAIAAATLMQSGATSPLFALELAEKDLGYAQHLVSRPLPLASCARTLLREAIDRGWGKENVTSVAKLFRE